MSLRDANVLNAAGETVRLGTVLDGPTLLIFVRHWGCMECSLLLSDVVPVLPTVAKLGVRIVIIGNGSPGAIKAFEAHYKLVDKHIRVFTDPTLAVQALAGMQRSVWGGTGPRALWTLLTGWAQGHPNSLWDGDWWQQGGVVLLDSVVNEVWRHDNTYLGDHASGAAMVEAAVKLRNKERTWRT